MKPRISEAIGIGSLVVSFSLLATGCSHSLTEAEQTALSAQDVPEAATEWAEAATPEPDPSSAAENSLAPELADGSVTLISSPDQIPLPPGLNRQGPFSDIVRMANSGLDESVLSSFALGAQGRFSLGAEEIIFLKDIGVPSSVVKVMLEHDHLLPPTDDPAAANRLPEIEQANFPVADGSEPGPQPDTLLRTAYEIPAPNRESLDLNASDSPPFHPGGFDETQTSTPDFSRELSPYGSWMNVEGHGSCWRPTVAACHSGWQPYCDRGHWVLTECGWYWRSDYSWGATAFHYGRWFQHASAGWCWRPDPVWGPAWVAWRSTSHFCGWAPLPPAARFIPGRGLCFDNAAARTDHGFGLNASAFCFVAWNHFLNPNVASHQASASQAGRLFNESRPATSIVSHENHTVNTHPGALEHLQHGSQTVAVTPLRQVAPTPSARWASHRAETPRPAIVNARDNFRADSDPLGSTASPEYVRTAGSRGAPSIKTQIRRTETVFSSAGFVRQTAGASPSERQAALRIGAPANSLIVIGPRNHVPGQPAYYFPGAARNPGVSMAFASSPAIAGINNSSSTPWWARPTPPPEETHTLNLQPGAVPVNAWSSHHESIQPALASFHHSEPAPVVSHTHHESQIHESAPVHSASAAHSETTHNSAPVESHHAAKESASESHSSSDHRGR